jgi:predicted transposase YdaD
MCRDCKALMRRVNELRGRVGYGEFLDELAGTGISKQKIMAFLRADPEGKGSVQDQITAEMTTELMQIMGIAGRQTTKEVKRIRDSIDKDSK